MKSIINEKSRYQKLFIENSRIVDPNKTLLNQEPKVTPKIVLNPHATKQIQFKLKSLKPNNNYKNNNKNM